MSLYARYPCDEREQLRAMLASEAQRIISNHTHIATCDKTNAANINVGVVPSFGSLPSWSVFQNNEPIRQRLTPKGAYERVSAANDGVRNSRKEISDERIDSQGVERELEDCH
jgi:hypothetical protein